MNPPRARAARPYALAAAALAAALAAPGRADATPYQLTPADRAEITQLLRSFFEAARDGNAAATSATIPTLAEFRALYVQGTEPFIERHQRAIERDVRELRAHFANGTWVGLSGAFARQNGVQLTTCGRFGVPASQCLDGPVIDWRVGTATRHMRIDQLVRINGHWKIFDPRL